MNHFALFLNFYWALFARSSTGEEILNDKLCQQALTALPALTTSENKKIDPLTSHVSGKHACFDTQYKRLIKEESHDSALHSVSFPAVSRRDTTSMSAMSVSSTQMSDGSSNSKKRSLTFSDDRRVKKRTVEPIERPAKNTVDLKRKNFANAKHGLGSQLKAGFSAKRSVITPESTPVNPSVSRKKLYTTIRFKKFTEVTKSGAIPSHTAASESISPSDVMKTCDQATGLNAGMILEDSAYRVPEIKPSTSICDGRIGVDMDTHSKGPPKAVDSVKTQRLGTSQPKKSLPTKCITKSDVNSKRPQVASDSSDIGAVVENERLTPNLDSKRDTGLQVNNAYPGNESHTSSDFSVSPAAADFIAGQEVNVQEEPVGTYQACSSSPVTLSDLISKAYEVEGQNGKMERLPKLEDPDLIQTLYQDEPPMILLTEQVKEELRWSHVSYPSHDGLCRFPKPPLQKLPPIWAEVCIHL